MFRFLWFAIGAVGCIFLLGSAARLYGDPASAIQRYREPATAPHVFVRGRLRALGERVPAVCSVSRERYQSCGKSKCWRRQDGMSVSNAEIEVEQSSSPVSPKVRLSPGFVFEPRVPPTEIVAWGSPRATEWQRIGKRANLDSVVANPFSTSEVRLVETCLGEGVRVFVEGCISESADKIERCAGLPSYGIVAGEPESVIDAAADTIALRVGGAMLALLVGLLAFARRPSEFVVGLESRSPSPQPTLGAAKILFAVPPIAALVAVVLHAFHPPSTWATGRNGFALGVSSLAFFVLFALSRRLYRQRIRAALTPILATPRSLLAHASGTVELAVRARLRGHGLKPFVGDDVVAFTEARIFETFMAGKNRSSCERLVVRACDELEVVDESGEGVLLLTRSVLDVERRTVELQELSPRYAERGVAVERHPNHVSYVVEERVIRDGEPLYVFGDVSGISLTSDGQGYRTVRGSPTLGGAGVAPVLVHAGDERGLVAMLTREARMANSLFIAAVCVCAASSGVLIFLASL